MATYDKELKLFDMELDKNLQKIFNDNRSRADLSHQKYIKKLRSQAKNGIALGTEYMDLNQSQYNEMDTQVDG